jgi:hypothetical protein
MYGIIAYKRNRTRYFNKPIVQRWTNPLHDGGDGGDVGEVGEASRATAAAFPSRIFTGTICVSLFRVSLTPPLGNASGDLYIVIFRSS